MSVEHLGECTHTHTHTHTNTHTHMHREKEAGGHLPGQVILGFVIVAVWVVGDHEP